MPRRLTDVLREARYRAALEAAIRLSETGTEPRGRGEIVEAAGTTEHRAFSRR